MDKHHKRASKKVKMGKYIKPSKAGGNWNNSSSAGAFARNLNNASSNSNGSVGGSDSAPSLKFLTEKLEHRGMLSSDKRNIANTVSFSSESESPSLSTRR